MVDVSARVKADTGSDSLAIIAAAGQVMNTEVWQPTGEVMAPVIGAARYIAGVREGIDGVAAGTHVVRGVETGIDTLRRLEFTLEPTVMNSGIFGGVRVGVKPPVTAAAEGAAAEATVSGAPLSLGYIESGRAVSGTAIMSGELTNPPVLMRGTQMSAGKVPLEVAEKMSGKEFASFDAFRRDFWKNMAESSYASEFAEVDILRMQRGAAPRVHDSQRAGGRKSYELHHRTPIHDGGAVYDLSNILIVTPKYHLEILEDAAHLGVRK